MFGGWRWVGGARGRLIRVGWGGGRWLGGSVGTGPGLAWVCRGGGAAVAWRWLPEDRPFIRDSALPRRLIPSMFHRRLVLLLAVFFLGTVVLAAQLVRLTVVQGARRREEAEQVLSERKLIGTERGRIYDREGRVLAEDRPSFDVAVGYSVITGQWAYREAARAARQDYAARWGELGFEERERLIRQYRGPFDAKVEELWRTLVRLGPIERGELERRKTMVVRRVQEVRSSVWGRRAEALAAEREEPVELRDVAIPVAEEREAHTLLPAVGREVAHEFRRIAGTLPGLEVVRSKARRYPWREQSLSLSRAYLPSPIRGEEPHRVAVDQVGRHILGGMGEVQAEDVKRRPFHRGERESPDLGGYLPGDKVGEGGVEGAMEDRLRGLRGQKLVRRDKLIKEEVSEEEAVRRRPPRAGKDVHLSIDVRLQGRIRGIMEPGFGLMRVQPWHENEKLSTGTPLYGSAVVLEVDSGDVMAMVSTPMPPPREPGEAYPDLAVEPNQPLINKAIGAVYPPGSTMKPLVYCTAAREGAVEWGQTIGCAGHLLEDRKDIFRCWIYRERYGLEGHGPLGPEEAIARSCNIYFYECGRRLGAGRLLEGFGDWGFGRRGRLGIPGEVGGMLPEAGEGGGPSEADVTMMGIGQGPIAVPPMQVAGAHAALARGGYYLSPVLIRELSERQRTRDLRLPPAVVSHALEGMRQSASTLHGTAHHLEIGGEREPIVNLEGVTVRAKTGTAQAAPQRELVRKDGRVVAGDEVLREGEHSWYVCHVEPKGAGRASYVVAVVVEYGGSGGRVAGPVVNGVLHALRAEGYL